MVKILMLIILTKGLNKIVTWKTPIEINPVISEMFYRIGKNNGGIQGFILKNINNQNF